MPSSPALPQQHLDVVLVQRLHAQGVGGLRGVVVDGHGNMHIVFDVDNRKELRTGGLRADGLCGPLVAVEDQTSSFSWQGGDDAL